MVRVAAHTKRIRVWPITREGRSQRFETLTHPQQCEASDNFKVVMVLCTSILSKAQFRKKKAWLVSRVPGGVGPQKKFW